MAGRRGWGLVAKRGDDDLELMRQLVVEFIGTFALMFFGGGAIIVTAAEGLGANAGLLVVALAHGLAIGLMVAAAGHISGGLYNPALTVGLDGDGTDAVTTWRRVHCLPVCWIARCGAGTQGDL